MAGAYTEDSYEKSVVELFQNMGYTHVYGPDVERDYHLPFYEDELKSAIFHLNPALPKGAVTEALNKLKNIDNGELVQRNAVFMDYLQNGISVQYRDKGELRSDIVYLADYSNPANNSFVVANQWTFMENSCKRPDMILFLNG